MRIIYLVDEVGRGGDHGESVVLSFADLFGFRPARGPCGWQVLFSDQGTYIRPGTYSLESPYGWVPIMVPSFEAIGDILL